MPGVEQPSPGDGARAETTPAQAGGRTLMLSPSRATDFKQCPLRYRLRAIDRVPEPPTLAALRGTLVHAVLEQLFARAPAERTADGCTDSIAAVWQQLAVDPEVAGLVPDEQLPSWLDGAADLVRTYFALEDPSSFSPEACELAVSTQLPRPGAAGGDPLSIPVKGFIDRLDVTADGQIRIVDYKTGRSPSEWYELGSLYQLKFYALMILRIRGVVPAELKLIYLADAVTLRYAPSEGELLAFERGVVALWTAITAALPTGDFPASPSATCRFCSFQPLCPAFGGAPPPYVVPGTGQVGASEGNG